MLRAEHKRGRVERQIAPPDRPTEGDSYAPTRSALAPRRTPPRAVWAGPLAPTWSAIFFLFLFFFLFPYFFFLFSVFFSPFFPVYFLFFFCNIF
jgi:hypothetical protein